jgi:uncharacterized repeat protein (TIGR03803 family)
MKKQGVLLKAILFPAVAFAMFLNAAEAKDSGKETTIFRFNLTDGNQPLSGLVADSQGNLYGTASGGGNNSCLPRGCGVVFQLSPGPNNSWTQKVIYTFKGGTADTDIPVTDLIFDAKGNLFGATGPDLAGNLGAVFELTPGAGGAWTEKVISRFTQQAYFPGSHLTFDGQGNLYGIVRETLNLNGGVFELSPQADGTWKEALIYIFKSTPNDGHRPYGGVVFDNKGDLFGTTQDGGSSSRGTVYELRPQAGGNWAESIIYNFKEQGDGAYPITPLTIDAAGNLFGTTFSGGTNFFSVVFELREIGGQWHESVLYTFDAYGYSPSAVVFDAAGNLYGTTVNGGGGCNYPGCGIVFELTPRAGAWKETTLHEFESSGDGSESVAGVWIDNATGRIYGTTQYGGGRYGNGTVFEVQP